MRSISPGGMWKEILLCPGEQAAFKKRKKKRASNPHAGVHLRNESPI